MPGKLHDINKVIICLTVNCSVDKEGVMVTLSRHVRQLNEWQCSDLALNMKYSSALKKPPFSKQCLKAPCSLRAIGLACAEKDVLNWQSR